MNITDKIPIKVEGTHYNSNIMCLLVNTIDNCNYQCQYCYNTFPRTYKQLDLTYLYKYLKFFRTSDLKHLEIELIGGEPLLNTGIFDFCHATVASIDNSTIKIYTNLSYPIEQYIELLKNNVILIPSWHSTKYDLANKAFLNKIYKLQDLGYAKQLDIRIMYEPYNIENSLNTFDQIVKTTHNVEFSLLVDKLKNEKSSELYSYTDEQLKKFYDRVLSLNNDPCKQEYYFLYEDGTHEFKCFNDLFGKNEYSFKHYQCDATKNNLYIHFNGNAYPCVDYYSHNKQCLFNIYNASSLKIYMHPILCQLTRCTCDWSITKKRVFK